MGRPKTINPNGDIAKISVDIPKDVHVKLREIAKTEQTSVSELVRRWLKAKAFGG